MRGIGGEIYEGAAQFGRFSAWVTLVFGNIVGAVLLGVGFFLLFSKATYSKEVVATIKDAKCERLKDETNARVNNDCILQLQYTVNKQVYTAQIQTTSGKYYSNGGTLNIKYNPENPTDVTTAPKRKTIGWILVGVGILFVISSWVTWWIVRKFKFAAAADGVGTAYQMFIK